MPTTIRAENLDFAEIIRPGDAIAWGQISGEPLLLTEALGAQCSRLGGVRAFAGMTLSENIPPECAGAIDFTVLGGAVTNRRLADAGRLNVLPCHLSEVPGFIASGAIEVDVALIQLTADDGSGHFNLGISADYMGDAIDAARVVVAEANVHLPWTEGDTIVAADKVDYVVPSDRPLLEAPARPPGQVERAIAENVARLVPDRATIQIGIGAIPDAVLEGLANKKGLGIHSGLVTDRALDLIEAGVVTNAHKEIDPGVTVTALLYGTGRLYRHANRNPAIHVRSVRYTHAQDVLARLGRFVAINAAIAVDLTGQVNAETVAGRHVGQIGGQVDFVRAGNRSAEGRAIIALRSTARDGKVSCITGRLQDAVATTARADVDVVVTEYGIAELRGRGLRERAKALLAVAHPDFRRELAEAAERLC